MIQEQLTTEMVKEGLGIFNDVAGPAKKELGEVLGDKVRAWRWMRQVKLARKIEEYAEKNNIERKQVPFKILLPLLDNATLEENETLQEMWKNLIVNAIDKEKEQIHPSYIEILRQLSVEEAQILSQLVDLILKEKIPQEDWFFRGATKESIIKHSRMTQEDFKILTNNLYRLRLCKEPSGTLNFTDSPSKFQLDDTGIICITELGFDFVMSCRRDK